MPTSIALGQVTSPTEFQAARQRGARVIPLTVRLSADLDTPLSLFLKVKKTGELGFLLESVEKGESTGRYSFLGFADQTERLIPPPDADPLAWLEEILPMESVEAPGDLPRFWGGAVGHLGWEAIRSIEPAVGPRPQKYPPADEPQHAFLKCKRCLIFDHVAQVITGVVVVVLSPDSDDATAEAAYQQGLERLQRLQERAKSSISLPEAVKPADFEPQEMFLTPREAFLAKVEATKEHIRAGDIFQLVLSQQVRRKTWVDAVSIYRALRMLNPSPYTFLLDFADYQLVGSSPEMLVGLTGQRAVVCPIAGTRRRTGIESVDREAEADMLTDPKERAEHLMLVDLGRNDLGRVCEYGSVEVPRYSEVEHYSHVMHMVSRVEGRLRPDKTAFDLVRSAFPAGTVSGAPKIRAVQLIDELEDHPRGFYAGAVGYFGNWGSLDTCIAIRTLMLKDGWAIMQAGAGIVADSDPAKEWDETMNKLAGIRQAIDMAEECFGGQPL
jgi:anthranilate synthase component 1